MAGIVKLAVLLSLPFAAQASASFPPVSSNCTEASSKAASWAIRNFTVDTDTKYDFGPGTAGRVSFSIQNTANGYTFGCLQGDGPTGRSPNKRLVDGKVWYSCNVYCKGARGTSEEEDPPLKTSFYFDIKTKVLSINQTWSCGAWDKSVLANYTGTGTSVIPNMTCSPIPGARPDQVSCAPVDVTVKASNVSAVASGEGDDTPPDDPNFDDGSTPDSSPFLPQVYPKPGVLPSTPGCSKLSQSPSFQVSNFYTTGGTMSFLLKNTALNYTQKCSTGQQSQSAGRLQVPTWANCTRFDNMHVNYPANGVYTSVLYGGTKNILGINQTWYCDDEDTSKPTVYSVYGEVNFPLKCRQVRDCIASSVFAEKPEKSVSNFCSADNLTITSPKINISRMSKEEAFEEFRPHGYNCSTKSLQPPSSLAWDITNFSLNKTYIPAEPKLNMTESYTYEIEFFYNNTATDNDWPRNTGWRQCLYQGDDTDTQLDGTDQLNCMLSFEQYRLGFTFDNKTSTLAIKQGWNCDGIDNRHTNYFTAVGSTHLPLSCNSVGNNTRCASSAQLVVSMANVTSNLNVNQPPGGFGFPY